MSLEQAQTKKIRVALLKSDLSGVGGLQKYTFRLADSFAKKGCEVFLLTTDCPQNPAAAYHVVNLGKRSGFSFFHLLAFNRKCAKWLAKNPVDVVFGLDRNYGLETHYRAGNGVHAAYLEHRKAFSSYLKQFSFLINPLHRLILAMEKKTFESPKLKKLFTNSHMVADEITRFYPGVDPTKIICVHNGVEWHELAASFTDSFEKRAQIQKSLGLNSAAYQFLFIGNEYQRKGLDLVLKALSKLKNSNFELSVVGKEKNEEKYRRLVAEYGLEKRVHFFGQQKHIRLFYQAADALVMASYYDPFANVTVEALAMGLFVVSSPKNGGSEVLTNNEMGTVFTDYTCEALTKSLENAMLKPKTKERASTIRNQVAALDFSNQIEKIVSQTLA